MGKKTSSDNEIVKIFWEKYCDAVNEKPTTSPEKAFSEIRAYGSSTLLIPFRDEPIPYHEVAYDVANILKPAFKEGDRFKKNDIDSCEKYVLEKMSISESDIDKICSAIQNDSDSTVLKDVTKKAGAAAAMEGAGVAVAKTVGQEVAKKITADAAKNAAKKAAKKAAEQAAQEAAKQIAQRILLGVNVFLAALTIISIAGPATRVTIPGVTYAALLRKMYARSKKGV